MTLKLPHLGGLFARAGGLRDIVGGAALVFAIRVGGAGMAFLSLVLLVRWMGAFEFGIYAYVWSWAVLLGSLLPLGFNLAVMRFVPEYRERGFPARLHGLLSRSRAVVALTSLSAAAVAAIVLAMLRDVVPAYYVTPGFLALACVPVLAFATLYQGLGRAFGWVGIAYGPFYILQPLLLIAGVGLLVLADLTPTAQTALAVMMAATALALAAQAIPFGRRLRRVLPASRPRFHTRYWIAISLPLFVTEAFDAILVQTDILVLGALAGPEQVAAYFAALRTAGILAFLHFAVAAMAAPNFARINASGTREELQSFVTGIVRLTFWPTLVAAVAMLAVGGLLLGLFDASFVEAYPALAILIVGLVLRAAAGPVEYILNMTGHQRVCARVFALVAVINLVANFALIPFFGIVGAAVATASANALTATLMAYEVRRRLGISSFLGMPRRVAAAPAPSACA